VGRDWFRVRTSDNRIFDLYYDRAPKGSDQRKGEWRLVKEMKEQDEDKSPTSSNPNPNSEI
jgi:hypothetical protein